MSQCLMELVTEGVDAPGVDPTENLRRNGLANLIGMLRPFIVKEMAMSKKDRKRAADTGGKYAYKGNSLLGDTIAERQ